MSRYIPIEVRQGLRQEVFYGCPIHGCGSPYLSYHHFDPPYHEGGTHNPEGMIALCLAHHKYADIGTYTNDQLKSFKKNPFLKGKSVKGRIEWMRRDIILRTGGMTTIKTPIFLEIQRKPLIWVKKSESGVMLLNMDIPGKDGTSIFKIVDNDWELSNSIKDLEAVPSGRSINISAPADGIELMLKFEDVSNDDFKKSLTKYNLSEEDISGFNLNWPSLLVTLKGKIKYPIDIEIKENHFILQKTNTFEGGFIGNSQTGISIA
ncbi:hypothetical protein KHA96_12000 [Bacillus sp. FJAT-49711]|uniref:HNH endonuclease n=1 Tax=Bacillus sp. FJAT-49711 TaxID=2833585 RepID=UPI001BCA31C8|nr:hypothetical protein [Bacillus sp. FJAT-49711]MBS4219039.1 hypothetical protein [Bacillus sp. FJAT-49711]